MTDNGPIANSCHELSVRNPCTTAKKPQEEILGSATNEVQSVLQLPGMPNSQVSPREMDGTGRKSHIGILPVSDIHSYSISPSAILDI